MRACVHACVFNPLFIRPSCESADASLHESVISPTVGVHRLIAGCLTYCTG